VEAGQVQLTSEEIDRLVRNALDEDIGPGDVTTAAVVSPDLSLAAAVVARESMVVCGTEFGRSAFRQLSPRIEVTILVPDGRRVTAGEVLLRVHGPAGPLLSAERVALNFMQRLSGVSTLTSRFVSELSGLKTRVLDTRKTTPGLRRAEKYAVKCGGGENHRIGLFDMVLIKDNHLAVLGQKTDDPVGFAVRAAREKFPSLKVEVEADSIEQVRAAVLAGADIILLDNMPVEKLREAVGIIGGRAVSEASGGVNLQTVRAIAETGVDFVSVGALTHSARAVDIGLDFETR